MRVLALRRTHGGAAKVILDNLAVTLDPLGIELVVDDCQECIPDKTGPSVDREVSKTLKRAAQGFDVVHAWGYRAAWACSEGFYVRFPWLYTAYDMPKTTHSDLVDRLNASHRGVCSTEAVRTVLDQADVLNLQTVTPGVVPPSNALPDRETARSHLGIREDTLLVVAAGRFVPDSGFESLVQAMPAVRAEHPGARLLLSGSGPEPPALHQEGVDVRGPQPDSWSLVAAANLVVEPAQRSGFSLFAAEAMWAGTPVLFRRAGGLEDMADDNVSGFFFDSDEGLAERMVEILELDMTREAVSRAAQVRATNRFAFDRFTREMAHVYREVGGA